MEFSNKVYFEYLTNGDVEGAIKYCINSIPDYLYKFYSLSDGTIEDSRRLDGKKLKTLKENCNWYDFSKNQNDPLDMRMAYFDNSDDSIPQDFSEAASELFLRLPESFLLCSFIDTNTDNLPMWAAYANGHYGYCVRYQIKNKKAIWRVLYENYRLAIRNIPLSLLHEMGVSSKEGGETEALKLNRYLTFMLLNTKHISWEHEHEYRIIIPAKGSKGQNFSNLQVGIIPDTVYIGYRCVEEYKQRIKDICKDDLHCACYEGQVGKTSILEFC